MTRPVTVSVLLLAVTVCAADAQDVMDRSPNISPWTGVPWTLHSALPTRFNDVTPGSRIDLDVTTTFMHGLGLPRRAVLVFSYAVQSPTAPGEPDEIEVLLRHRLLQSTALGDLFISGAWNSAAVSWDAEAVLTRRLGPLKLMGAARWFSDARGRDESLTILAGGVVWHPLPRAAPVSFAGDVAFSLDDDGSDPAWSAGAAVGIPHTALTLAFQVTNTAAGTLQGRSTALGGPRYGFELTAPVPVGYIIGRYPPRGRARQAVTAAPERAADVSVDIRRHAFGPMRIEVRAGAVVEWVNRDAVVHTATAEDRAWDSGAIEPGASWRGRFDEPGVYPYYCGPHSYMKGVVIVR